MAPPSNTTSATAIVIPSLPYINVQTGIHDAGTTYTVWYKYIGQLGDDVCGLSFRGDGVIYFPDADLFIDNDVTQLGTVAARLMDQIPIIPGRTYFFRIRPNAGNPTPATLTVNLVKSPDAAVFGGSIFIRGASILSSFVSAGYTGLAGGYINPATGEIYTFKSEFSVGESGDYMPGSGELLFVDEFISPFNLMKVYTPTLQLIASVPFPNLSGIPRVRTSREHREFYIGMSGGGTNWAKYKTMDALGNITSQVEFTGLLGMQAIANSADNLHVYSDVGAPSSIGAPLVRWVKASSSFTTDLFPGQASHTLEDILVMKDGTVLAMFHQASIDSIIVKKISPTFPTGTLLGTWTAPADNYSFVSPRMGYANDDSISFWVFLHSLTNGMSRFMQIRVSDLTTITNITAPSTDYLTVDRGDNPAFRLVTSDSCPLVLIVLPEGGIYFINPPKPTKHDSYYGDIEKKIPNPTFKTAFLGE